MNKGVTEAEYTGSNAGPTDGGANDSRNAPRASTRPRNTLSVKADVAKLTTLGLALGSAMCQTHGQGMAF